MTQPEHEECDDGNEVDGDGCDSNCTETAVVMAFKPMENMRIRSR